MRRSRIIFPLLLLLFLTSTTSVSANHRQEVLGDSTISSVPSLPATADGPGLILPDSPFYFLDTLKQNIRLFLAFTPEQKAEANAEVAGERLAEVRFELAKNNTDAAQKALEGVSDHLEKASENLTQAKLRGRDVTELAQKLNEKIKEKRDALSELETTSTGELKARVGVALESLRESKVKVEDALPEDQLQQEVEDDLHHQIEQEIEDASHSARGLEHAIDVLEKNASEAAEKNQIKREEALRHAIEVKNEALKKQQEKALDAEKKKGELQQKSLKQAREVAKKTQEAAQEFRELKKTNRGSSGDDGSSDAPSTSGPTPSPVITSSPSSSGGSGNTSPGGQGSSDRSGSDH